MSNHPTPPSTDHLVPEVLEEQSLTVAQLARACRTSEAWVVQRVTHGVLRLDVDADATPGGDAQHWRFSGHCLLRARRIVEIERTFGADPELAALTADLMEEVQTLRRLLGRS